MARERTRRSPSAVVSASRLGVSEPLLIAVRRSGSDADDPAVDPAGPPVRADHSRPGAANFGNLDGHAGREGAQPPLQKAPGPPPRATPGMERSDSGPIRRQPAAARAAPGPAGPGRAAASVAVCKPAAPGPAEPAAA